MDPVGKKIKKLRSSLGISQEQLAEAIGSNVKSIQRYETEKSRPDTFTLIRLAAFFDVSTDYLLGLMSWDAEREQEKKRYIHRHGQYSELYKRYLACKNDVHIDEAADYYWIELTEDGHPGGQTAWVGWADKEKRIEIRELRPVIPQAVINLCAAINEKPMLLNTKEDAELFLIFGGQAVVRADICEKYLPEFCRPYISDPSERPPIPGLEDFEDDF